MARIAIVGGGISGLYACHLLSRQYDVTLYEAASRLGGHSDTHQLKHNGQANAIDSGFIVFNKANYPRFTALLDALKVQYQPSDMSFSVHDEACGMEYCASHDWQSLFARRRNCLSYKFYMMLKDLMRFYAKALQQCAASEAGQTLRQFLESHGYNRYFCEWHIKPMVSALWSASYSQLEAYPIQYILRFMSHHQMLQTRGRPEWLTVTGGSQSYVNAMVDATPARFRVGDAVHKIIREPGRVWIKSETETGEYDAVIIACHSDQARLLLDDASDSENEILGAIPYQLNEAIVHCDTDVMPRRRNAWGSWNVRLNRNNSDECKVSYYMNRLQNLTTAQDYIVSLNQTNKIRRDCILLTRRYHHPVFTPQSVAAQQRWSEINGTNRTWYAGAYWGWGFHEDGVRSAIRTVRGINEQLAA